MSKPDPAGGSLENILASIRKSLSEQSTEALSGDSAVPVNQDKDAKPPRKNRLTQRLAGATAEAPPVEKNEPGDDLSDLLEEPPSSAAPASSMAPAAGTAPAPASSPAASPAATSTDKDPLWFLTRRDEAAASEPELPLLGTASQPASASAPTPVVEPKLTRPEVLRASMPPFFGSSAETAKSAAGPAEPASRERTAGRATADRGSRSSRAGNAAGHGRGHSARGVARGCSHGGGRASSASGRRSTRAQRQGACRVRTVPGRYSCERLAAHARARSHGARPAQAHAPPVARPEYARLVAEALGEEVQRTRATPQGDTKKT